MKSSRQPANSERPDSSQVPRLSSIPRYVEEWLDTFFDGSPTVRFTCTPQFYDRMYPRLKEAAAERGYDPDLIVGRGGTLEFRLRHSRGEQQSEPARDQPHEVVSSLVEDEPVEAEELAAEESIAHLEYLRDEITRDSELRQGLACRAVAAGIKKIRVYISAGVTAPTLKKWLHDYTPQENDRELKRLDLRRLQLVNTRIRSNTDELRELATKTAIATGNVAKTARAAGLSRQAIYRWLKMRTPASN